MRPRRQSSSGILGAVEVSIDRLLADLGHARQTWVLAVPLIERTWTDRLRAEDRGVKEVEAVVSQKVRNTDDAASWTSDVGQNLLALLP